MVLLNVKHSLIMIQFIFVFFLIVQQCCYGNQTEEETLPATSPQNSTNFISTTNTTLNLTTAVNDTQQGFKKVISKVKVGIGKIKTKINNIRSKIGGTGDGGGTTYYRRPYRPTSGRGGIVDPTFLWVLLGLVLAGVVGTVLYYVIKR